MCRLIRISLQVPTPLLLIQRDHIPWCIQARLIDYGSLDTWNLARTCCEVLTQLLNLIPQLLEGDCLNFPLRVAFGMRKPFALILPKYPIWSFHSGEHSEAVTI